MSTLVVGSAVMAFEEVCPERIDLIHANYKKLCCLLVDVEEWGQIVIINMLTRYARTQFLDPNNGKPFDIQERPFYDDSESLKEDLPIKIDKDHRLLLANTKPLLQSRNAAVVLSVAQLYQHIAPHIEVIQVARALVRLLRSHREIQAVGMFEPYLKSFFVRSSDPTHIKILKLEVMTNLATPANIAIILREFQTYIWSSDKEFVASTIQAIGRCASNIKEVTDSCLSGLSHMAESVVGESVVVVRKLLQSETDGHKDIITHMARLVDNIRMPTARASILWLLGEYCDRVPKIAPDVLRKMAKSFTNETDLVKLQIVTLATKLYLTNPKQTHLLCQYIFNLAKYDASYDIRDRARFIKALIFPVSDKESCKLSRQAKKIFLAPKIPPVHYSNFKDRNQFQLGTLSHLINARASGYCDLPPFPKVAPDSSVRERAEQVSAPKKEDVTWKKKFDNLGKSFYSEEEDSASTKEESEASNDSSDSDNDSSSSSEDYSSEEESSSSNDEVSDNINRQKKKATAPEEDSSSEEASNSSVSSSYSSDSSDSDSSDSGSKKIVNGKITKTELKVDKKEKKPLDKDKGSSVKVDLLLDLENDSLDIETPVLTPSLGGFLSPMEVPTSLPPGKSIRPATPMYVPTSSKEILNKINGYGLSVSVRFTRSPHLFSASMTNIELTFKNNNAEEIKDISVGGKRFSSGITMHDFASIPTLSPGASLHGTVGIDFNDSITSAVFDIISNGKTIPVSITPTTGDLIDAVSMSEADFNHFQSKLKGMNEHSGVVSFPQPISNSLLINKLYESVNVLQVPSSDDKLLKFGGQTSSSKLLVLISVRVNDRNNDSATVTVHCEMMMIASMLFKHLQNSLSA
ncbi:AP-3 complex subunit beta-1 [Armadillidium nasatum]|uniref:AP-3 complex subunit beta-1 n=1 Tax=Armadillidium nasatum TaxID=96803 RepID=A0A5N5TCI4_9CRUS|nr:AP-3 complex subunit beta-1 [Armadillidium nasatum]